MRAVAYCRYSSENQRDGYSIEAQLKGIRDYCTREGIELVDEYIDEAKTGTNAEREQFQRMIANSSKGLFDAVIVHKLDRFSRDRYDSAVYKKILKDNHIRLFSTIEKLDDSPESVMLEAVIEGMAEFYSKNLSRETKKGLYERARKGLSCANRPFGYDVDKSGKFVENQIQSQIVKEIFNRFCSGQNLASIARYLSGKGIKGARGADFSYNSLKKIISNTIYCGTYTYGISKSATPVVVEGAAVRIIDDETWNYANDLLLKSQRKSFRRFKQDEYFLTGILFCGNCGSHFSGYSTKAKNTNKVYQSYRCTGANHGKSDCNPKYINKLALENFVLKTIADDVFTPHFAEGMVSQINERLAERNKDIGIDVIRKELSALKNKKSRLLDVYLDGGLEKEAYIEKNLELSKKIDDLQNKEAGFETFTKTIPLEVLQSAYEHLKKTLLSKSPDEKAGLILTFIEKVTILETGIEIIYKIKGSNGEPLKANHDFKFNKNLGGNFARS